MGSEGSAGGDILHQQHDARARAEAEGDPEQTADVVREVAEKLQAEGAEGYVRQVMLNPPL